MQRRHQSVGSIRARIVPIAFPHYARSLHRCIIAYVHPTLYQVSAESDTGYMKRDIITFLFEKRKNAQNKAKLDEVHEYSAPLLMTIYFYISEFKYLRTPTKSKARLEPLAPVIMLEMMQKIHGIDLRDSQIKVHETDGIVSSSIGIEHKI